MTNSINTNGKVVDIKNIRGRSYLGELGFVKKTDAELFLDFRARLNVFKAAPEEKARRIAIAESFSPVLHTNWRKTVGFFTSRDGIIHPLTVLIAPTICSIVRGTHDAELIGDFAVELYVLAAKELGFNPEEWDASAKEDGEFIEELFADTVRDLLPDFRRKYRAEHPQLPVGACSQFLFTSIGAEQRQRWGTIHGQTIRAVLELMNAYPSEWCDDFASIAREASNKRRRVLGTGGKNILPETAERVAIRARAINLSAGEAARFSDGDLELLFRYLKKAVVPQHADAEIAA